MDKITVKYGDLKKIIKAIEKTKPADDTDISFEYIVGSCFPNIMENIKREIHAQYTQGYIDGLNSRDGVN